MTAEAATEFVERCAGGEDVSVLIDAFQSQIGDFGFEVSVCGAWAGVGNNRSYRFYFNFWPQDWLDIYERNEFVEDDPLVAETRRRMKPFLWSEVMGGAAATARMLEIKAAVADYGWEEVMAFPFHGPGGYQAMLTLATRRAPILSVKDRALLQMMAVAIHDRCRASDIPLQDRDFPHLTERELESLRWVAAGKTDWEIAQLLKIAPATAHFHVEKAKKKLGVNSRVQAIALMALRGLI